MSQLKQKTTYTYKLFLVLDQQGRSTTVSIDPVFVSMAIKASGDVDAVGRLTRKASLRYDKGTKNCGRSRFVQRQLILLIHAART